MKKCGQTTKHLFSLPTKENDLKKNVLLMNVFTSELKKCENLLFHVSVQRKCFKDIMHFAPSDQYSNTLVQELVLRGTYNLQVETSSVTVNLFLICLKYAQVGKQI